MENFLKKFLFDPLVLNATSIKSLKLRQVPLLYRGFGEEMGLKMFLRPLMYVWKDALKSYLLTNHLGFT